MVLQFRRCIMRHSAGKVFRWTRPVRLTVVCVCVLQVPNGPAVSLGSPVDSEHYEVARACVCVCETGCVCGWCVCVCVGGGVFVGVCVWVWLCVGVCVCVCV